VKCTQSQAIFNNRLSTTPKPQRERERERKILFSYLLLSYLFAFIHYSIAAAERERERGIFSCLSPGGGRTREGGREGGRGFQPFRKQEEEEERGGREGNGFS